MKRLITLALITALSLAGSALAGDRDRGDHRRDFRDHHRDYRHHDRVDRDFHRRHFDRRSVINLRFSVPYRARSHGWHDSRGRGHYRGHSSRRVIRGHSHEHGHGYTNEQYHRWLDGMLLFNDLHHDRR